MTELLSGRNNSPEVLEENLRSANVSVNDELCAVLIIRINHMEDSFQENREDIIELNGKIVAYIEPNNFGYSIQLDNEQIAVIINAPGVSEQWCKLMAGYIYKMVNLDQWAGIIGIGSVYQGLRRIKYSYMEAEHALQYRYLTEARIINYKDINTAQESFEKINYPDQLANRVFECIKLCSTEDLNNIMQAYLFN